MKYVKLVTAAYVGGALRHPHEGVLHVDDADAKRLLENEAAEDVTSDFPGDDTAPAEVIAAAPADSGVSHADAAPHQVEVAPQAIDDSKPARRKAAATQE